MKLKVTYLFLFILIIVESNANNLSFRHYKVENGLSENSVFCILQDVKGFLWFGTKDGLNRFDGQSFISFHQNSENKSSIGNNFIRSLYEDKNKKLWVGTEQGIYMYDYTISKFTFLSNKTVNNQQITQAINSICEDFSGNIWIGTSNGLFVYNEKNNKLISYYSTENKSSGLPSNFVSSVICDSQGIVWVGTLSGGLSRYNSSKKNFTNYTLSNKDNSFSNSVLKIIEDSQGNLILGTVSEGLVFFDRKSAKITQYLTDISSEKIYYFRDIFEYSPGVYLVGSEHGLIQFNKINNTYTLYKSSSLLSGALSDNAVYSIYRDREGGIWVGTYFGGVNYISPNEKPFELYTPLEYKNSIRGKAISQMCEDDNGNLWIGTEDGGLNYFNTKTNTFKQYTHIRGRNSLSYHNVHSLLLNGEQLWIGTFAGGLNVLNIKTGKFKYYTADGKTNSLSDNNIFSVYKDLTGEIWIGTINGLNRYNPESDDFEKFPQLSAHSHIYDILQDHNGLIWVATYGRGVFCYDPKKSTWIQYQPKSGDKNSISHSKVISIYLDEKHRLWFGTEGGGLCQFLYDKKIFKTYNTISGLPNNVVYTVVSDNDNLWLSTNKGIACFNPETNKIRVFTKDDGLQGDQFNFKSALKTRSGKIYFGGTNGFNAFFPSKIIENKYIPSIVLTSFQLFNTEVKAGDENSILKTDITFANEIILKHNQTNISFEFVALSYSVPEKNQYAYKLEGLDKNWNYIGNERKISFNNLPSGNYTLLIKASNNDALWNEKGIRLKIKVLPPFWRSIWAFLTYILLSLFLVYYSYVNIRKKHLNEQRQHIEKIESEKEIELYNAKIDFFTNIAHEIRTPLSLIKAPLDTITKKFKDNELNEYLGIINRNADRLLSLVNQLLDFRKVEKNSYKINLRPTDLKEQIKNISESFKFMCSNNNIKLIFNIPEKEFIIASDPESLNKILSNLLSNAVKHARSQIIISLSETDNAVECRVYDNGEGISSDNFEKIFLPFYQIQQGNTPVQGTGIGLALAKLLTDLMSGSLSVESEQGNYTCFTLKLPLSQGQVSKISNQVIEQPDIHYNLRTVHPEKKSHIRNSSELSTIMFVEDSLELKNYLFTCFKDDFTVITASNGIDAIKLLENFSPDIIITDIVMPEMGGLELCRHVKTDTLHSHIPVILLTAKTDIQQKIEGIETGADAYIEKPFSVEFLEAQILNLLEGREKLKENFINSPLTSIKSIGKNKADDSFLQKITEIIEFNMTNIDFSVEDLSNQLNMSRSNLHRKLKGISGLSPNDFIRLVRLKQSVKFMNEGETRINEICFMVGFNSPSYFAKCFKKQFGVLPKNYINS